jgi:hypothetical protein
VTAKELRDQAQHYRTNAQDKRTQAQKSTQAALAFTASNDFDRAKSEQSQAAKLSEQASVDEAEAMKLEEQAAVQERQAQELEKQIAGLAADHQRQTDTLSRQIYNLRGV